ncbi:D-alanyl-D-alanine carboxypeptidase family protein [Cohnella sp. 56]|uniref:D-alanyl-D-alanine carboxypeptidase family protein n=1 Tax=Cohnella sp. 56 TaxID=3113722 RepID=UPI0030EA70E3
MKSKLWLLLLALVLCYTVAVHKGDMLSAAQRLWGHPSGAAETVNGAGTIDAGQETKGGDDEATEEETKEKEEKEGGLVLAADHLYSSHAILVRLDDGKTLMEKKQNERVYPASLTKIMTAILAIERIPDLSTPITLDPDMFAKLQQENASVAGFLPGERVSAIDLLYGVMLPSGADASIGLATHIAGSEKKFAALMNKKAKSLGMNNTHFANATGLHDPNHYTTVRDLSVLLAYALKNDTFREAFTASRYSTRSTKLHPDGITLNSTMFDELPTNRFDGGEIVGGKTGYTEKAGLCLASLGRKDGREYILITTGAKGNHRTAAYNVADALAVYGELGNTL